MILSIDIETFSSVSITDCGMHKYVESKDFEILLFGYSFNDEPVEVVDLTNFEVIPDRVMKALTDPSIIKTAWNAGFEMTCIAKHFKVKLNLREWYCTMAKSALYGYPLKLEKAAEAMKMAEQKDTKGKALIKYFTTPCDATEKNKGRRRNMPEHAPEKWDQFIEYCRQDVVTEKAIAKKLSGFPFPDSEKKIWDMDQVINSRGVFIDIPFIKNAIRINDDFQQRMVTRAGELTGLQNPNSLAQLKKWLSAELPDEDFSKLNKETVTALLKRDIDSEVATEVLGIRQAMGKSSVGKYYTMLDYVGADGRVRGQFQYYGAGTGRWAGRGTQPHNLPKTYLESLEMARKMVSEGQWEIFESFYNVPDTLSELIRPSFIPKPGHKFIISDFKQIEARVLSWLAKERWRMEVFVKGTDIYQAGGSAMFRLPMDQCGKGTKIREQAKVAELALGYQGGPRALEIMDKQKLLRKDELQDIVYAWRNANRQIVQFWYAVGNAAIACVAHGMKTSTHGLTFFCRDNILFIKLHSGRLMAYPSPEVYEGAYGPALCYKGQVTGRKWVKVSTYGGKLVENIVQAESRDILAEAMLRMEKAGYPICLHVHDETVTEVLQYVNCLDNVEKIMSEVPAWATGLPIGADCFESLFYRKD